MNRKIFVIFLTAIIVLPIAVFGCKGKVDKPVEEPKLEVVDTMAPLATEGTISAQQAAQNVIIEPAQTVAVEAIPPTAAVPETAQSAAMTVTKVAQSRDKDIQNALKNAGFYTGAIDGKIGPKTKKAVMEFQKANGLKDDGKVGPKTWAALEKYLAR